MKTANFKWSYNSELDLRNDPKMTREKLAQMVRSWRKDKAMHVTRKASKGKTLFTVRTGGLVAFSEVTA